MCVCNPPCSNRFETHRKIILESGILCAPACLGACEWMHGVCICKVLFVHGKRTQLKFNHPNSNVPIQPPQFNRLYPNAPIQPSQFSHPNSTVPIQTPHIQLPKLNRPNSNAPIQLPQFKLPNSNASIQPSQSHRLNSAATIQMP